MRTSKIITVDLSKQNVLDAAPRAIQQIVFQEIAGGNEGTKIRLYTILKRTIKRNCVRILQGNSKSVLTTYKWLNTVNVKLTDTQLKKLKTAVKNKTGTTLRMNLKMLDVNDLPHKLLLTTRQKTKLRNMFNNNMS